MKKNTFTYIILSIVCCLTIVAGVAILKDLHLVGNGE